MLPTIHFTITGYALMTGVGLFCSLSLAYSRNDKFLFSIKELLLLVLTNILGAAIGSKILFFLVGIPGWIQEFSFKLLIEKFVTSGFVFYGGLIGAIAATFLYCKILKLEPKRVFDFAVPSYLSFHACGRIGCLLGGCCYGKESALGFVMADGVRRFPVQLLESICILAILVVILKIEKDRAEIPLLQVYLFLYPVCRFVLEFLRGDEIRGIWAGLSTSQWISLMIFFLNLFGLLIKKKQKVPGKEEGQ